MRTETPLENTDPYPLVTVIEDLDDLKATVSDVAPRAAACVAAAAPLSAVQTIGIMGAEVILELLNQLGPALRAAPIQTRTELRRALYGAASNIDWG